MSIIRTLIQSPIIFGTFKVTSASLSQATNHFRIFDAATGYDNLTNIGEAISPLPDDKKPIILLKFNSYDFKDFALSTDTAVKRLGKEPEIVLLHSPLPDNILAFKQLRSRFPNSLVGVSNFDIEKLQILIRANCKPDIISVEFSPYYQPRALINFCRGNAIIVTGYRCLAKGKSCTDSLILSVAEKYLTSSASIVFKWSLSEGVYPIFTTNNPDHMYVDDSCNLSLEDINTINSLDQGPSGSTCMLKYCNHDNIL